MIQRRCPVAENSLELFLNGAALRNILFRTWLGPNAIPEEEFMKHLLGY